MVSSRYDKISCTCNKNKWCHHDRISLRWLEQESFYVKVTRFKKYQITFMHTHQWFRHDTIKLVVHATRTNGVVTIGSHSVGLKRKVFMFLPSFLRTGFSMRYKTSIFLITVGLLSLLYLPWKSGRNSYTNTVSGSSSSLIWELRGMQKF